MTAFSDFYESERVLLGDHGERVKYPDAALDRVMRAVLRLGKVPGYGLISNTYVTPEVPDANIFARIAYHTAKLFLNPGPIRYSYRTRALSESFEFRTQLLDLEMNLHTLENGNLFHGWQEYWSWIRGQRGLPEYNPMVVVTSDPGSISV